MIAGASAHVENGRKACVQRFARMGRRDERQVRETLLFLAEFA
jgi:hypothetical protein